YIIQNPATRLCRMSQRKRMRARWPSTAWSMKKFRKAPFNVNSRRWKRPPKNGASPWGWADPTLLRYVSFRIGYRRCRKKILRPSPSQPSLRTSPSPMQIKLAKPYREAVGILLLNPQRQIFVGHRIDTQSEAWQMPQGGIDRNESPEE